MPRANKTWSAQQAFFKAIYLNLNQNFTEKDNHIKHLCSGKAQIYNRQDPLHKVPSLRSFLLWVYRLQTLLAPPYIA